LPLSALPFPSLLTPLPSDGRGEAKGERRVEGKREARGANHTGIALVVRSSTEVINRKSQIANRKSITPFSDGNTTIQTSGPRGRWRQSNARFQDWRGAGTSPSRCQTCRNS